MLFLSYYLAQCCWSLSLGSLQGLWQLSVAENLDLLRADDECTSEGSEGSVLDGT